MGVNTSVGWLFEPRFCMRAPGRAAVGAFLLLTCSCLPATVEGQRPLPKFCDPALTPEPGPSGYAATPALDRCEGYHTDRLGSASDIPLLAVLEQRRSAPAEEETVLTWTPTTVPSDFSLRVQHLGRGYRLDTVVAGRLGRYAWPSTILRRKEIKPSALLPLAWISESLSGTSVPVAVPLAINPASDSPPNGKLYVVVGAQVTLTRIQCAVSRLVGGDPRREQPAGPGWLVQTPPFPAGEPIWIPVTLPAPGLYKIRIDGSGGQVGTHYIRVL